MTDYSKLSDDELSIKVVECKFGFSCYMQNGRVRALNPDGDDFYFDINNPLDSWPIILESKVSLNPYDNSDEWFATTDTSFFVDDKNPLRAAMIVYLMMQEQNNG